MKKLGENWQAPSYRVGGRDTDHVLALSTQALNPFEL